MVRGSHVPPAQQAAGFADWPALKGLAAGRLGVMLSRLGNKHEPYSTIQIHRVDGVVYIKSTLAEDVRVHIIQLAVRTATVITPVSPCVAGMHSGRIN